MTRGEGVTTCTAGARTWTARASEIPELRRSAPAGTTAA